MKFISRLYYYLFFGWSQKVQIGILSFWGVVFYGLMSYGVYTLAGGILGWGYVFYLLSGIIYGSWFGFMIASYHKP